RLAQRFRSFDPKHYEAYTAPNLGAKQITLSSGAISDIVAADPKGMRVMFRAIAENRSPAAADGVPNVDPTTIRVAVLNGTFTPGAAQTAGDALRAATTTSTGGINITTVANANSFDHRKTLIRYRTGAKAKADLIAAAIPGAKVQAGKTSPGIDVVVIVGKHFKTKKIVQLIPIPLPKPEAPPPVCQRTGTLGHGP
ncbi:MAG: LytR C-terminal domain-containing protein, partial [Actinomycetota bacterium]|nr:LytR C-terminal domain-containing protein [Actinomycetota bacterium]